MGNLLFAELESFRQPADEELLAMRIDTILNEVVTPLSKEYGFNDMQTETLVLLRENLSSDQTVDLPTRSGKSHLIRKIAEKAAKSGLRTAILTHRRHIVGEHFDELEELQVVASSLFDEDVELITADTIGKFIRNVPAEIADSTDGVDLVLIDEAHRALGEVTRRKIARSFPSAVRMAFTATPDFAEDRSVTQEYGDKIISHSPVEAIDSGLISPLRVFVHKSEGVIDDLDQRWKDFSPRELKKLANHFARNQQITDYVEDLVNDGRQGIVSTIPGEGLLHADQLKTMIEKRITKNPDGSERMIRAGVVGGKRKETQEILDLYQLGQIDVILFCDLITEGWTSEKASFFINGRPTTSIVNLTQQLGRIMQLKGRDGIAVDFFDNSVGKKQRTLLEVLEMDRAVQGVRLSVEDPTGPNPNAVGSRDSYLRGLFRSGLVDKLLSIDNTKIAELLYPKTDQSDQTPYQKMLRDFRKSRSEEMNRELRKYDRILINEGLEPEQVDYFGMASYTRPNHELYIDPDTEEPFKLGTSEFLRIDTASVSRDAKIASAYSWLGSNAVTSIILPVVPASEIVDAWDARFSKAGRDVVEHTDEQAQKSLLRSAVNEALAGLSERGAGIIRMRFGIDTEIAAMTLDEVGDEFGLTRERIRQLESKSLASLRNPTNSNNLDLRGYVSGETEHVITNTQSPAMAVRSRAEENWKRAYRDFKNGAISAENASEYAEIAVKHGAGFQSKYSGPLTEKQVAINRDIIKQRDKFEDEALFFVNSNRLYTDDYKTDMSGGYFSIFRNSIASIADQAFGIKNVKNDYKTLRRVMQVMSETFDRAQLVDFVSALAESDSHVPGYGYDAREKKEDTKQKLDIAIKSIVKQIRESDSDN